jgi:Chitobiase/beta-hexosaminidase C-terminal domain
LLLKTVLVLPFFLTAAGTILGQGPNVLTWRYDNTHQGQNTQEAILTPANVNTNTFGKLFSHTVDGQVYAQPLYIGNLTLPGQGTHNVFFIATENDSVYAFDADSNGGADSAPLWHASMLSTAHGAASGATTVPTSDVEAGTTIVYQIGITSTPVIDLNTNTMFVLAKSKENGNYVQRLHALNILTGNEQPGSPVALAASVPGNGNGSSGGTLAFSTKWQHNRPALGLFDGNIYIPFGSHEDNGPWHGWVLVYNETTLKQTAAVCQSPNGNGDAIWMSGAGMPIDTVSPNGRAFLVTSNGDLTSYPPLTSKVDYGESILRYDLSNGGFAISDAFTPFNQAALTGADLDQGSAGILLLPDQPGPYPHLMVQVGKEGRILVLNRDNLGGYKPGGSSNTNVVQDITGALKSDSGLWSTPAYWNGNVYMWAENDSLKMFPLTNGVLATRPTAQASATSAYPGATPVVSSNGTQNGIVWAVQTDLFKSNGSAILYAFNAANVAQQLYASDQNSSRDDVGPANKFAVPVVTNGKVYVGSFGQVDVYGLLNAQQQAPAPVISPSGGAFSGPQKITLTDTVTGAAIYYTTDGSTPTTASTLYAAPFQLSTDTTVQAFASASGYLQSPVTSATYAFNTQTPTPQFTPAAGTYTATQTVAITDSSSGATIYYTTDGSAPTTSSTRYTGPITVSSSTVINAIATLSGLTNSNVASASYTIQPNGTGINFGNGFAGAVGLTFNGSATNVDDTRLQLTTGLTNQAGSAFYNTPTNIQAFTTDFAFQLSNAQADGFTFTIQDSGPTALGAGGGSLGYGLNTKTGTPGIAKSLAIKFDFYNNAGEGTDSTGLYVNGALPTVPAIDMTSSGVLLNSGDTITAHMTYDGVNLILTLTDIVVNKTFTHTFPINIPGTIGSNLAYIGFTGGSGGLSSSQKILSWTFASQAGSVTQTPVFSPAGGTFGSAQQVKLSDGTTGAVVYYTVDGSVPTTSSTVYSSPISVDSGSVTIKALAQASGLSASSVASATFTIQPGTTAMPTFSPGTGTYTSTQSVSISDSTSGATIHYTTDGSTPTTSSAVYSSAITVSTSTTLKALAVASGLSQSAVASAAYVIQTGGSSGINFAAGFPSATGLQLNSVAKINGSHYLELTNGGTSEASSVFWNTPVNVQTFTTNFTFQLSSAVADGFTFTIQNAGLKALGSGGGGLGYGPNTKTGAPGIGKSIAVKFDIYSNSGEGNDSTGLFTGGATPTTPAVDLTSSGIVLASGDTIAAQIVYDGTTLTLNLTDTVTLKVFSHAFAINIPSTVGGDTAYVGFTGGTGGYTAIENIKTWTFVSSVTQGAADPVLNPVPGIYTAPQQVSLNSTTPGATIYYTVDGSTPTHSSAVFGAPIVVSGPSLTIRAFASANGYQDSPVVAGTYQIQAAAPPP